MQLCRAVEQWEPRTETVAVHAWLHPWLPYLGSRMDQLYPTIRFKLSAALQQWHPSDQSALALLRPWHTVMLCTPDPPPAPLHPLLLLGPWHIVSPLPLPLPTGLWDAPPSPNPLPPPLPPPLAPLYHVAIFEAQKTTLPCVVPRPCSTFLFLAFSDLQL